MILSASLLLAESLFSAERVIVDTDMFQDSDDVGALVMLHKYADDGKVNILAVMHNAGNSKGPAVIDVINTYWKRPNIPIGRANDGGDNTKNSVFVNCLANKFPYDLPSSLPKASDLYREQLSKSSDKSITIISMGFWGNLKALYDSGADQYSNLKGRELIEKKVKQIVIMGGYYCCSRYKTNYNFVKSPSGSVKKVIDNWPTRVVVSGLEIGQMIERGEAYKDSLDKNPAKWAHYYNDTNKELASWQNKKTFDQTAVMFAIEGKGNFWDTREDGFIDIRSSDVFTKWSTSKNKDQSLMQMKASANKIGKYIENIQTAEPKGSSSLSSSSSTGRAPDHKPDNLQNRIPPCN